MSDAPPISFRNVDKGFSKPDGTRFNACRDLTFDVKRGEVVAIVGETGCGKSTSFNMLLGLQRPDAGEVRVLGQDPFGKVDALRGRVGIIFQSDRLLPWRTTVDNIAFGLDVLGVPREEQLQTARRWLERIGLKDFEHAYPHELSGGMRQRISIARAFAIEPEILFADEAFTALDELTAARIRKDLLGLIRETHITTLFITHLVPEAVDIANRILVYGRPGRVIREVDRDAELARGEPVGAVEAMVREGLRTAREIMIAEGTAEDVSAADFRTETSVKAPGASAA